MLRSPGEIIGENRSEVNAGFSLLEVLLVCLLLSLLLGLVIPSLQWSYGNEPLKKGVRQLSVLLREARAQARREGTAGWLWFSGQEKTAGFRLVPPPGRAQGAATGRELVLPMGVEFGDVLVGGRPEVAEPVEVWISPRGLMQETWLELRYEGATQWLRLQPLIDDPELHQDAGGRVQ